MAASFTVVYQNRDIEVLGPTIVRDVQRIGIVTHPTGIFAEWPVEWDLWVQGLANEDLQVLADAIEGLIAQGPAVDGSFTQDVGANGLVTDYIDFIVRYVPPGGIGLTQETTVRISERSLMQGRSEGMAAAGPPPESLI